MDLEAYYDWLLPNIGSIVQESIGAERNIMQLLTKVILQFEHHIYTSYRISTAYYGGLVELLASTGQGNMLSGNICYDISYLVIKIPEKK